MAAHAAACGVAWFEEPVSSDDLDGSGGDCPRPGANRNGYRGGGNGYDSTISGHMLAAGATDVQQADATRCGVVTVFLAAATLCDAYTCPYPDIACSAI